MQGREELLQELRALQTKCTELMNKIEDAQLNEPTFEKAKRNELYYMVMLMHGAACGGSEREDGCGIDEARFNNNNYFKTPERAAQVADKINYLLLLERLHDTFCPSYVPDWYDSDAEKWYVYYDNSEGFYEVTSSTWAKHETIVYFSTEEIAQKVCGILNKKLEEKT